MRSRPRRICWLAASLGSAPISGTVQICGAGGVCCAEEGVRPNAAAPMRSPSDARIDPRIADRKIDEFTTCFMSCPQDSLPSVCKFLARSEAGRLFLDCSCPEPELPIVSSASAGAAMVQRVATVAFEGIEARAVDVQVQVAPGLPAFNVVGLPDKAVSEARERVRAALVASGLALPARRITVNLAPADLPKEGSHYDLPIALGLMAAIGAIPADALAGFTVLGELGLDGSIAAVAGVLPAAIAANAREEGLICPAACGPEAAWAARDMAIIAPESLIQLANHIRGVQVLSPPQPIVRKGGPPFPDLRD